MAPHLEFQTERAASARKQVSPVQHPASTRTVYVSLLQSALSYVNRRYRLHVSPERHHHGRAKGCVVWYVSIVSIKAMKCGSSEALAGCITLLIKIVYYLEVAEAVAVETMNEMYRSPWPPAHTSKATGFIC